MTDEADVRPEVGATSTILAEHLRAAGPKPDGLVERLNWRDLELLNVRPDLNGRPLI